VTSARRPTSAALACSCGRAVPCAPITRPLSSPP